MAEGERSGRGEAEIYDDAVWTDGDFEVITTADNVRFRVPSFHLFSSSAVLRNAHSVANGAKCKITFTDPDCETADIFRLFLGLASKGRLLAAWTLDPVRQLVMFLDKYECIQARRLFSSRFEIEIRRSGTRAHDLFLVAAAIGDTSLCRLILTRQAKQVWGKPREGTKAKPLDGTPGWCVWDCRHWPSSTWNCGVPNKYLFALARAFGQGGSSKPLADEFERYLGLVESSNAL
ncbi:hypothetical protein CC85DRAFT_305851 [Cutaneotrichosporon oleaginosum]|uniref:BTB domain-containing protein n=1 Tax=Cutaneotrichosporon oleaginosum TaxID=879819 RepID=A0A0J0XBV6_9TREE|nr:uncharacterized protein CC85DRAFT_305851 [Cutaneotrichosporon oleaginosum]KLT38553.1 hypothetical protein CC85DRAFT_305851 [Cutaneotrichosporon oleaginosum]TXT08475.1 hypothetical protein COLE_05399 [Cutaneotrichosporon oleaginosum]